MDGRRKEPRPADIDALHTPAHVHTHAVVAVYSHHGVGLPGASLPVREDARVVTAEGVVEERISQRLKHFVLPDEILVILWWKEVVGRRKVRDKKGIKTLAY